MTATRLIIDTDPGVDDAFALALAARHPDVELLAVTTVFGNVGLEHTTRNALRLLTLCGRPDVPVAAGAARPLVHPAPARAAHVHGADGLSGRAHTLPEHPTGVAARDAVTLLADVLAHVDEPVTLVTIGPMTNIAALLAAHPWVTERIGRIVVMGGSLGSGNITAAAEFNVGSDPEAAARVLGQDGPPRTLVGLDVTLRVTVDEPWLAGLGGEVGEMLAGLTAQYFAHYEGGFGAPRIPIHDALAVAEAIHPGTVTSTGLPVTVDTTFGPARGATIADQRVGTDAPGRIDVATDVDPDKARALLHDHLAQR